MGLFKIEKESILQPFKQEDFSNENYENLLEVWVEKNPMILIKDEKILFIGRQERLEKKPADLLGVDKEGNTVVIELKRGETPRETIAQALEYAAYTSKLDYEQLDRIAINYFKKNNSNFKSLLDAFNSTFLEKEPENGKEEIEFNKQQRIFIIGQEIEPEIEKVARYLRENGMDMNCVEFSYYKTSSGEKIIDIDSKVGREELGKPKRQTQKGYYSTQEVEQKLEKVALKLKEKYFKIRGELEKLSEGGIEYVAWSSSGVDYRIRKPVGTIISISVQTQKECFRVILKFGNKKINDPKKFTKDVTHLGYGNLNRMLYIHQDTDLGNINEEGSILNLMKQAYELNIKDL